MTAFHFGNVQWGGELLPHSFSKVGFHYLWISGVIEMMTPFIFFASEMGVQFGLPSEIRFAYQSADNLSTTFKARCKTPFPLS